MQGLKSGTGLLAAGWPGWGQRSGLVRTTVKLNRPSTK
jgi:hypothetical protein